MRDCLQLSKGWGWGGVFTIKRQCIGFKGRFTRGPKSQHGGKVPTFELQGIIKIWLIIIKLGS